MPSGPDPIPSEEDGGPDEPGDGEATAEGVRSSRRRAIEWVVVVVGAVALSIVVRTFVLQTFWIPSESMATTLVEDDRVLVDKVSYRFRDPRRGEVVVFERPDNLPATPNMPAHLVKRVIAVAGERVSILGGEVRVDGRVLDEPYTHGLDSEPNVGCGPGVTTGIDTPEGFTVPDGHLFVMGDNRTHSYDGRCFGPIDDDLVVGRGILIVWPPGKVGGL